MWPCLHAPLLVLLIGFNVDIVMLKINSMSIEFRREWKSILKKLDQIVNRASGHIIRLKQVIRILCVL